MADSESHLSVVPFPGGPPLNNIVAQLRGMADRVEAGEYGEVESLLVVLPREEDYPILFGWGDIERQNDPIIQLDLMKHWLLSNLVAR